jgi:hypothetical protein
MGASAAIALMLGPTLFKQPLIVLPGEPTYYDRVAWSSFNGINATGKCFAGDGTGVVWTFVARLVGGAARRVVG